MLLITGPSTFIYCDSFRCARRGCFIYYSIWDEWGSFAWTGSLYHPVHLSAWNVISENLNYFRQSSFNMAALPFKSVIFNVSNLSEWKLCQLKWNIVTIPAGNFKVSILRRTTQNSTALLFSQARTFKVVAAYFRFATFSSLFRLRNNGAVKVLRSKFTLLFFQVQPKIGLSGRGGRPALLDKLQKRKMHDYNNGYSQPATKNNSPNRTSHPFNYYDKINLSSNNQSVCLLIIYLLTKLISVVSVLLRLSCFY